MNGLLKSSIKILTISILFIITGCSSHETGATGKKGPGSAIQGKMGPLPVDVYKVPPPHDIPVELKYPARIRSGGDVTIVARVSGILQKMSFTEGEFVKKGTLLFKIEPDLYKADVAQARARLQVAKAKFKRAERDWKRVSKSYRNGAASEQERDMVLSAYESAKAAVSLAKAELEKAEINLRYTHVTAPVSGKTGMRLIDPGNMVGPGTPLVKITKIDPIYAEFSFPDMDMIKLRYSLAAGSWNKLSKILKARLLMENMVYEREGKVDFIGTTVDERTSSVKARAIFSNPEGKLLPGMFMRIVITGLVRKNVIEIPQQAVIQAPAGANVYVMENGKAMIRSIEIGDEHGTNFIVEKGLKPGEMVITNNLMKIRTGMPVKVSNRAK